MTQVKITPKPLPKIEEYGPNAIEVQGLTFAYDSNPNVTILNDLNLTLPTGSRCLLIGANGSGKLLCLFCMIEYIKKRKSSKCHFSRLDNIHKQEKVP